MSRRGEDKRFHPHPGDPWHPEWQLEAEGVLPAGDGDDPGEGAGQTSGPTRKGMGLFGRRRHQGVPVDSGRPAASEGSFQDDGERSEPEPPPWIPDEAESAVAPVSAAGEAVLADAGRGEGDAMGGPAGTGDGVALSSLESAGPPAEDGLLPAPVSLQPLQEGLAFVAPSTPPAVAVAEDSGVALGVGPTDWVEAAAPPAVQSESPDGLDATEEDDWFAFVGGSGVAAPVPPADVVEAPRGRRRLFGSRRGDRREKVAPVADQGTAEWLEEGDATPPPWDPETGPGGAGSIFDGALAPGMDEGELSEAGLAGPPKAAAPMPEPAGAVAALPDDAGVSDEEWERLFGDMDEESAAAPSGASPKEPVVERPVGIAPAPAAPPPQTVAEPRQPAPPVGDTWAALRSVLDAETVEMGALLAAGPAAPGHESTTGETFFGAATIEHRDLAEAVAAADTAEIELQALSAPMAGLDMGIVGFEDVVDLGSGEEFVAPAASDFLPRVVTGLILVGMLLGSLWVGGAFMAGFIGLIMCLGLTEYHRTLRSCGHRPLALFAYLAAIGLLLGTWHYGLVAIPIAIVGTAVVVFFYYALAPRRRDPLTNGGLTVLGVAWVVGTAAFAFPMVASPDARVLILAVVAATVAMDIGAYSAGRSWGSSPLAPNLSPNKSVEGLAGGVVLTIGVSVAMGYLFDPLDIRSGAALGLVVAAAAPLGDLAESMLKRSLGVKDMGSMLPGHGGILDRVDAFLFVLPAAWVLYQSLGLLG